MRDIPATTAAGSKTIFSRQWVRVFRAPYSITSWNWCLLNKSVFFSDPFPGLTPSWHIINRTSLGTRAVTLEFVDPFRSVHALSRGELGRYRARELGKYIWCLQSDRGGIGYPINSYKLRAWSADRILFNITKNWWNWLLNDGQVDHILSYQNWPPDGSIISYA